MRSLADLSGLHEATGEILIGKCDKKMWRPVVMRQKSAYR